MSKFFFFALYSTCIFLVACGGGSSSSSGNNDSSGGATVQTPTPTPSPTTTPTSTPTATPTSTPTPTPSPTPSPAPVMSPNPDGSDGFFPTMEGVDPEAWTYIEDRSDEFNDTEINLAKWDNDVNDWGPWSWEPDNTYTDNGVLKIRMRYEEHDARRYAWAGDRQLHDIHLYYTSGILRSRSYQTYGYYEARIKGTPTFPGNSPAFWIYSINSDVNAAGLMGDEDGESVYSEIDIVELQQSEWDFDNNEWHGPEVIDMNLHTRILENGQAVWRRPGAYPELTKNTIHADFDPRDDFHIYGVEVTEQLISWYLDGEKVAEKPNHHWYLPMRVTLSLGLRRPHVSYNCTGIFQGFDRCPVPEEATEDGYPTEMEVDWVRVYMAR